MPWTNNKQEVQIGREMAIKKVDRRQLVIISAKEVTSSANIYSHETLVFWPSYNYLR